LLVWGNPLPIDRNKCKKISVIIHGLGGGGAEGVCVTLANALADRGFDIDLIVSNLEGDVKSKELSDKVNLINFNKYHVRSIAVPMYRYLAVSKPDVVLCFNRHLSVVIGLIRCLSRMRFKLISRNITIISQDEKVNIKNLGFWSGVIPNILVRVFFPFSDIHIAEGRAMKEDLAAYLKIDAQKIIVIHSPVNKKIEDYLKKSSQSGEAKEDYLLCIGRLEPVKAFNYAIEAFSRITDDYPLLRLKMVGQGSLEDQLKQMASNLNIAGKVDFEGYREDTIPYYVHARLTMLTSLYEGFPNVLIESIALGTPVVSFNTPGGAGEIVQDGINGYLAKYQDTDSLAECLKRALDRQWEPEVVRATADRFSSEKIIDEYERIFA